MRLQLTRPLVFFDLETTGVNISADRIVEISLIKQLPGSAVEGKCWRVKPVRTIFTPDGQVLREDVIHIPADASAVHHIFDSDVSDCPTFRQLAPEILEFIRDCDLAGYNSNHFDVPMLQEELLRNGFDIDLREGRHFVDAFVIFQKHTPRNLTAAYRHYCGKNLEDAHSADADTEATRQVLLRQVDVHDDVPTTVAELETYTTMQPCADMAGRLAYNADGEVVFNFGKHKGRTVREVFKNEASYYNWMMDGDFPLYTKRILTNIMQQLRAERNAAKRAAAAAQSAPASEADLQALASRFSAKSKNAPKSGHKPDDGQQSLF